MTCYCIGRNYREHAAELGNPVPERPLVFSKPATAVVTDGRPVAYPDFSTEVHFETELVLRVSREAHRVTEAAAWDHLDALTLGLDLTARDLQAECKASGHPWEVAKAWDGSAPVGRFVPIPEALKTKGLAFESRRNGERVQWGLSTDMLFPIPALVAYLSRYFTLLPGDLIFTGTPAGVGPIAPGDRFTASLFDALPAPGVAPDPEAGKQTLLDFEITPHG
jgi:acylpyruvate hydrolase